MIVVIDKSHKRAVNKLAKEFGLLIEWEKRKPTALFDRFDIEDPDDSKFYSLKEFKKRLVTYCSRYKVSVNFGLMDDVLEARAERFMQKYTSTFEKLKAY